MCIKMLRHCLMVFFCYVPTIFAHSWMSCPKSFNTYRNRGGDQTGPCEKWYIGGENDVNAGDRLKVGWTSNNHGGGYARIALVKATTSSSSDFFGATGAAFKQNVIKFACYGSDTRPNATKYGVCTHPCNARPGCQYQSDISDVERFDTTITIPTNLNGLYILQTVLLLGNGQQPYYSCAKLNIRGGNPSQAGCSSTDPPPKYQCHQAGGGSLETLSAGTKRGDFCYYSDRRGEVDHRIDEEPVNLECDPRIFCDLSMNPDVCFQEDGMRHLQTSKDNSQPDCGSRVKTATCRDGIQNQNEDGIDCGGPCADKCISCSDGIRNQGEEGVDCGGVCPACKTCFDGIKNQDETGIDCGGATCKPCPMCHDGVKNQGEEQVDCGGPYCPPCPSCSDGKQNQGEGGIDCGGPCCNTCGPTCSDNIHNQDEEGVDCGGSCKACVKPETVDYVNVTHMERDYGSGPLYIVIVMTFLKDVPRRWKFRVEYNQKIDVLSSCGAAKIVGKNGLGNIFTFESNSWSRLPSQGDTRRIYVIATKTTGETLRPTGELFEVEKETDVRDPKVNKSGTKGPLCGGKRCDLGQYCMTTVVNPCTKYPCTIQEECSDGQFPE